MEKIVNQNFDLKSQKNGEEQWKAISKLFSVTFATFLRISGIFERHLF